MQKASKTYAVLALMLVLLAGLPAWSALAAAPAAENTAAETSAVDDSDALPPSETGAEREDGEVSPGVPTNLTERIASEHDRRVMVVLAFLAAAVLCGLGVLFYKIETHENKKRNKR